MFECVAGWSGVALARGVPRWRQWTTPARDRSRDRPSSPPVHALATDDAPDAREQLPADRFFRRSRSAGSCSGFLVPLSRLTPRRLASLRSLARNHAPAEHARHGRLKNIRRRPAGAHVTAPAPHAQGALVIVSPGELERLVEAAVRRALEATCAGADTSRTRSNAGEWLDTAGAAAYTIGAGGVNTQTLTLGNSGSITMNSTVAADQTINALVKLGTSASAAAYFFTNNSTSTQARRT